MTIADLHYLILIVCAYCLGVMKSRKMPKPVVRVGPRVSPTKVWEIESAGYIVVQEEENQDGPFHIGH